MQSLRREPFRLLFPLGALLAWAGILPWVLFGTGLSRMWLGVYHALTLTQAFLLAVATGFLGTMIPRRSGGRPLAAVEIALVVAGLVAIPVALLLDQMIVAQLGYAMALLTLAQYAIGRLRASRRPVPPSFLLIPLALGSGLVGSAMLAWATFPSAPAFTAGVGRALVEEGVLLPLVLALAPVLTPILLDGTPPADASSRRARAVQLVLGAALVAGFVLTAINAQRAGELVRAAATMVGIVILADVTRRPRASGLHRRVYQLAMLLVPVGLFLAALVPVHRLAFLHVSFVGGLSLLVFAVTMHVTFLHTGRDALARRSPWPVAAIAGLTVLAAIVRAAAEHAGAHYVEMLALASSLWLVGAVLWGAYLLPMLVRPPREGTS